MYPIEYTWTSMPIVVTTISSAAVSASTWKPMSTLRLPAGIQVHSLTSRPASPNGSWCPSAGTITESAINHTMITPPTGTISAAQRPNVSWSRRPNSAVNANPRMGISRMRGISVSYIVRLPPHRVVLVDERRLAVAVDRDHDRQPDRGLGRRGCDHDQRDRARRLR